MGATSQQFTEFVMEQLAPIGELSQERFFGGIGLKSGGAFFGMLMDEALYFVVDDLSRPEYEKMGSHCFSYSTQKGRVDVNRFFAVPADVLDDQAHLVMLAKASVAIAHRPTKASKPKPRKKTEHSILEGG